MSKKHFNYVIPIVEWANERGLNKTEFLPMQLEKSREENAELTKAITKYENGNKDALIEIKDAIGDVYVTLVIAARLKGMRPYFTFNTIPLWTDDFWDDKDRADISWSCYTEGLRDMDTLTYVAFTKQESDFKQIHDRLYLYINYLNDIAINYDLNFVECIDYAYNTISKRTGKMIDGSFVKDK